MATVCGKLRRRAMGIFGFFPFLDLCGMVFGATGWGAARAVVREKPEGGFLLRREC
jgi:hypothetical protein